MSDAPLEYASTCIIPTTFTDFKLIGKKDYNYDSQVYSFEIPGGKPLGLPVCACILLKAPGRGRKDGGGKDDFDGSDAVRPYTPFSPPEQAGSFDLLVKRYDGGAVSTWLHELPLGSMVGFKHIKFNIKAQYPFEGAKRITLLCAGTGLTPMFQALHKLMTTPGDDRPVVLLYGNKAPQDILLKEQLDAWAKANRVKENSRRQPARRPAAARLGDDRHVRGGDRVDRRGEDFQVLPRARRRHDGLRVRAAADVRRALRPAHREGAQGGLDAPQARVHDGDGVENVGG